MNDETYEALKNVLKISRKYAAEKNNKKRKSQEELWEMAVLYRDIVTVEDWIEETAKKHK